MTPRHPIDDRMLALMTERGMDLTESREVDFWLYFNTRAAAEKAADEARLSGYRPQVKEPIPGFNRWLCLASRTMVLNAESLALERAGFEALTARLGGEFDGWGVAVVPAPEDLIGDGTEVQLQ